MHFGLISPVSISLAFKLIQQRALDLILLESTRGRAAGHGHTEKQALGFYPRDFCSNSHENLDLHD